MELDDQINKSELIQLIKEYVNFDIRRSATTKELVEIIDVGITEKDEVQQWCPLFSVKKKIHTVVIL